MSPTEFTYWLQGFVELSDGLTRPSEQQWQVIKDHLKLVLDKQTPNRDMLLEHPLIKPQQHLGDFDRVTVTC